MTQSGLGLSMTDPIQRETSLIERVRKIGLEGWRRFVYWSMLGGVLLYIFGEISSTEWAIKSGIFLLLIGIASALLYKAMTYLLALSGKDY